MANRNLDTEHQFLEEEQAVKSNGAFIYKSEDGAETIQLDNYLADYKEWLIENGIVKVVPECWEDEWKMKMDELPTMYKDSIKIEFDIENDVLTDVLNDNNILGLSHASEEKGKIALHVVDDWTLDSAITVKSICQEFGYQCFIVE